MRYKRMGRYRPKRRKKWFLLLLILFSLFLFMDLQLRPLINTITASQAKYVSVNAINEAVEEALSEAGVEYQDLITVQRDTSGNVLAISTDSVKMNLLKSKLNLAIEQKLSKTKEREVSVPLGTLIGGNWFRGRGPGIPLHISFTSNAFIDFKSTFESAGINQTKHQISLEVHTGVAVLIPGFQTTTEVETNVAVAETIIVGQVPEFYASLGNGAFTESGASA
jgi:sporulation protein YunB